MKKVHKVALCSVMQILTQCSPQGSALSALKPLWLYTGICRMYTRMNKPLNSVRYSSRSGFADSWLIILISISFQFYYWRSSKRKILEKSQIIVSYTHCIIYKFHLNPFISAEEMDFLIIGSLFLFLYLSSSITGEVANKKFWKNHRLFLYTPTVSYPNFSSIRSLQLKKWISWLMVHYSHFYIFPVLLLEK